MFERYVMCRRSDDVDDDAQTVEEGDTVVQYYSPMDVAITAAHRLLRTKVRNVAETMSGKRDGVGVLLYGCDPNRRRPRRRTSPYNGGDGEGDVADDSSLDDDGDRDDSILPTTHKLIELAAPGIEQVLTMQECLPDERPYNNNRHRRDLCEEFSVRRCDADGGARGEDEEVCSLRRGLTAALKVFSSAKCVRTLTPSRKYLPDSKAVWIYSNQDDPCHGSEVQQTRMNMLKRDCQELGVVVHVLLLPKPDGSSFVRDVFYNDLVTGLTDDYEDYSRMTMEMDPTDDDDDDDRDYAVDVNNDRKLPKARVVIDMGAILDKFTIGTNKRRKYASLPLLLPGWKGRDGSDDRPGIMLDLYSVVQVRNRPQKVSVHQETNK
jgi:hypothetical protein